MFQEFNFTNSKLFIYIMSVLRLVVDQQQKEQNKSDSQKSHIEIAIDNNFIIDILNIWISPSGGRFHLSMKTEIDGYYDSLWLNFFGEKTEAVDLAIKAIDVVVKGGLSKNSAELLRWKGVIKDYSRGDVDLIMLP